MSRRCVVLINPPNSCSHDATSTTQGEGHSDWANYAHLGLLSLATALEGDGLHPVYLDGVVCPMEFIESFLVERRSEILIVGLSLLTANYRSGLRILAFVKELDASIVTVVGNDHFTALHDLCLRRRGPLIDCGFLGNETLAPFRGLARALSSGSRVEDVSLPSMVRLVGGQVRGRPSLPEPIPRRINYNLIDDTYPHSAVYARNFRARVTPALKEKSGVVARDGVPVEIARGCIKFLGDDACSFCSIQYGGLWKNELPDGRSAAAKLRQAIEAGFDYLYITADELTLTFRRLLSEIRPFHPGSSASGTSGGGGAVLAGYTRADGLAQVRNAELLRGLGFRVLMVGVDAGTPTSLRALNKPLRARPGVVGAEAMHAANAAALANAAAVGLCLRLGFVIGHLGMTPELLADSLDCARALIRGGAASILSVDAELLSPEPGSVEFRSLTDPALAESRADRLGLRIAPRPRREQIAAKWGQTDLIDRDEAILDYIEVMMPELRAEDCIGARNAIRSCATAHGVLVGA